RHIAARLDGQPYEIAFPTPFITALRLLGLLPTGLQLALGKRLSRSEQRP
ncbi:MAG TPA: short-chain dehydrogenase, partial [Pseudomonas sp.]|nr:short-chain dehydrogenase [Pseudomonas sp.]